ncbi:site-2 protease family protein [Candidatus Dependentiae bacterium]
MFSDQLMKLVSEIAILFPAFLVIFTFRGFFTALVAKKLGDDTAYNDGFLSLNPLVHIDLFGLLFMLAFLILISSFLGFFNTGFLFVIFILLGVRWSITVPINDKNFKYHTMGIVLTTLASSLGSCFVILFFMYLTKYFPYQLLPKYAVITVIEIFQAIIDLSTFWAVLDLIPIPPFNAGRLLKFILPSSCQSWILFLEEYSIYVFLGLFFIPGISHVFFRLIFKSGAVGSAPSLIFY